MIVDVLFGFILALPNMLLNSLTSVSSIAIPDGAFDWFKQVFSILTYVFPVWAILPILGSSIIIKTLQIGWALLLRVKSFIPTMGS